MMGRFTWSMLLLTISLGVAGCASTGGTQTTGGDNPGSAWGPLAKPVETLSHTGQKVRTTTVNGVQKAWSDTVNLLSFGSPSTAAATPAE